MIGEARARHHPGRRGRQLGILALLCVFQAPAIRGATFVRGDTDTNGATEISDPVRTLNFLFLGSPASLDCDEAADSNDDGRLDIADGVFTLAFLFSGGPAPPAPFPDCGEDSDNDLLMCESFQSCSCDGIVPGALSGVNTPESHGLRLLPGRGGELIAVYYQVGNAYGQRLTEAGALIGERVRLAPGVVDFDAAVSGETLVIVHVNGGRLYGTIFSAADLSVSQPETLIFNPGAATDRVRINHDAVRGTLIVVYEIGSTLAAFSVPFPALAPASPSRILSVGVSRRFAVSPGGSPACVFYTLDADGLLRGVRLNSDGSRDGATVQITQGTGDDVDPAVTRSGTTLGLTYGHSDPGADRWRFVVLDAGLSPMRGPIDLPGQTDRVFLVYDPPGVDLPTGVANLGDGRFLVTALNLQFGDQSHWYAHEVRPTISLLPASLSASSFPRRAVGTSASSTTRRQGSGQRGSGPSWARRETPGRAAGTRCE
jgi:hypothetical protein